DTNVSASRSRRTTTGRSKAAGHACESAKPGGDWVRRCNAVAPDGRGAGDVGAHAATTHAIARATRIERTRIGALSFGSATSLDCASGVHIGPVSRFRARWSCVSRVNPSIWHAWRTETPDSRLTAAHV